MNTPKPKKVVRQWKCGQREHHEGISTAKRVEMNIACDNAMRRRGFAVFTLRETINADASEKSAFRFNRIMNRGLYDEPQAETQNDD